MKLTIGKQYNCITASNQPITCLAIVNNDRGIFVASWSRTPFVSWYCKVLDNGKDIECANGNYYDTIQEALKELK